MVGAAYGTWHYAQYCLWGNGQGCGICKECGCQHRSHSCVLHAHLDGQGAFLCLAETEETPRNITECISETVVAEDNTEHEHKQRYAAVLKLGHNLCNDSTDYKGQASYADAGHDGLYFLENGFLAQQSVCRETDTHRY